MTNTELIKQYEQALKEAEATINNPSTPEAAVEVTEKVATSLQLKIEKLKKKEPKAICIFCQKENKNTCAHLKGLTVEEVNCLLRVERDDVGLCSDIDDLRDNTCEDPDNKETGKRWMCVLTECGSCQTDAEELAEQFGDYSSTINNPY